MLIARDLSVEVGGRLTLEGASFDVRAGDKVALVGRNGAGKTSLLRVLGGDAPAKAGSVVRQGRFAAGRCRLGGWPLPRVAGAVPRGFLLVRMSAYRIGSCPAASSITR